MKTTVATLVLLGAALTAGLALAQTPAQPRGGQARTEPGSGAGETRATISQSGGTLAMETIAPRTGPVPVPGCGPVAPTPTSPSTRSTTAPVDGIGGQGGGRLSNRDHIDQDAQVAAGDRPSSTDSPSTVRGTGGGRYTFVPTTRARIINNSETDTAEVDGAAARPGNGAGGAASLTPCAPNPTVRR